MAQPIAEAYVELQGRTAKYKAKIAEAKRKTTAFGKSAAKSFKLVTLGVAAMGVAAGIAAVAIGVKLARALIRAARASVTVAVKFDKLKRGLTAVMGGAAQAARELINLREVARMPGLGLEEAIQGSINLQAVGFNAKEARDILLSFGNALVTVGKGKAELDGVTLALTQMRAKGKILAEEINQLAERVPQVRAVMMDAFGTGAAEDIQKMNVSVEDFIATLVTGLNKLPKVTGGIALSIENLEDEFKLLKITIGNLLLPSIEKVLDSLSSIVEKLTIVVGSYKDYGKEASIVLRKVALIGLNTTAAMLNGMFKMMQIAGENMFEPLLFGGITVFNELNRRAQKTSLTISKWLSKLAPKEFETTDEQLREQKKAVDDYINGLNKMSGALGRMAFAEGIAEGLAEGTVLVKQAMKDFMKGVTDINSELDKYIAKTGAGKKKTEGSAVAVFSLARTVGILNLNFADLGFTMADVNLAFGKSRSTLAALANGFKMAGKHSDKWKSQLKKFREEELEKIQKDLDAFKQRIEDFTRDIRLAMENLFVGLISGENKKAWEQFWDDLKQIAIRKLAEIAAAAILNPVIDAIVKEKSAGTTTQTIGGAAKTTIAGAIGGIAGGILGSIIAPGAGTKIGAVVGSGLGADLFGRMAKGGIVRKPTFAMLGERGPEAVIPLNRAQPSSMNRPLVIESINFYETDFANMDRTRLTKTVRQQIMPIIQQAAADGIGG